MPPSPSLRRAATPEPRSLGDVLGLTIAALVAPPAPRAPLGGGMTARDWQALAREEVADLQPKTRLQLERALRAPEGWVDRIVLGSTTAAG